MLQGVFLVERVAQVLPIAGLPFVFPALPAFAPARHMGVSALRGGRAALAVLQDAEAQLKKFERHVPATART